ncbi:MAG: lytic transglycosylase F, partial [Gammaproteobacteria bacterium]
LYQIDWRFLAAIGYQESHWKRRAISPTGVRGIMMLTLSTASQMGVKNRLDARQSIMGGAEYFRNIHNRIPYSIPEPDRTLMALAAYNMGLGHLKDLRKLTRERGEDSMKWVVLKKNLPLLQQKRWYKKTRHGYARGNEAKRYVENIWRYYVQLQAEFTARGEPQESPDTIDDSLPSIMAPAI